MPKSTTHIRYSILLLAVLVVVVLLLWTLMRLKIETDITRSLPRNDPVIASAMQILSKNPYLDSVVIDLSLQTSNSKPDRLVKAANWLSEKLRQSGLFNQVGFRQASLAMPILINQIAFNLPQYFDQNQIKEVEKRLQVPALEGLLKQNLQALSNLGGMGQAQLIAADPLRLRELVLARLAAYNPVPDARLYRQHVLSADQRHLLLVAKPIGSSSDTALSRKLADLFERLRQEIKTGVDPAFVLVAVGAYQAALDNENIIHKDIQRALWVATIGIALLLLVSFSRPWFGLFALIPAVCGACLGLFVYSLFQTSISALALGFGGALVSITVDHGIAYLQFLDSKPIQSGKRAAGEVWAIGLFATLTTSGAFLTLTLSGFRILAQVGLFSALGVACSFLFVHTVFPRVFVRVGPSARKKPLYRLVKHLVRPKRLVLPGLALLAMVVFSLVGFPEVFVSLRAMNTIRPNTEAQEQRVKDIWGDVLEKTHLLIRAESAAQLRYRLDKLASVLASDKREKLLTGGFSPAMVAPGPLLSAQNLKTWQTVFTPQKIAQLTRLLRLSGQKLGYSAQAFDPFLHQLLRTQPRALVLGEELQGLLGIYPPADGLLDWIWSGSMPKTAFVQKSRFDLASIVRFQKRCDELGIWLFNPALFSKHLGALLADSFLRMLIWIGLSVLLLLLILFLDLILVALICTPLLFALMCTLGTMKILARPIDIPSLMLTIIVFGMGLDYAVYFVRAKQRYLGQEQDCLGPVYMSVFLAGVSTLLGMFSLMSAEHAVLASAGVTAFLGIAYSLLGAFLILPPLLQRLLFIRPYQQGSLEVGSAEHRRRVSLRYRHLAPYPRLFAWSKIRLDPMFSQLQSMVCAGLDPDLADRSPTNVLDIGCGLGVPAAWLLVSNPQIIYCGIDPDPEAVRIAKIVVGQRGRVLNTGVLDDSVMGAETDLVLMLDVMHYLDELSLTEMLSCLSKRISSSGRLVIRATIPSRKMAWERSIERLRLRLRNKKAHYRSLEQLRALLHDCGLALAKIEATPNREETWLVATVSETA